MQKNKAPKVQKVDDFDIDHAREEFMEMMEEMSMHNDAAAGNTAVQVAPAAMNTAIELSKLVVENRVRNASNMGDDDIYSIYLKSFASVMDSATGNNGEE